MSDDDSLSSDREDFSACFQRVTELLHGRKNIVVLLGAAFYAIDRYSVRLYYEELSQRLNSSLAMYVANAETLISGGEVNGEALTELSNRAMVINPTAEIYLLAPDGRILGHALPPDEIAVDRVDVAPIKDMLSEARTLPIKGINPRNPGARKVFSGHLEQHPFLAS